jgi:putative flavoprotein involved in K+ transport
MDGGETTRILKSKKVRIHPLIRRISQGTVTFTNGEKERYDLIIMATGFRPSLGHLNNILDTKKPLLPQLNKGEHLHIQGLYFLGIDHMISFKSRYVRGVVGDSRIVAQKIVELIKKSVGGLKPNG